MTLIDILRLLIVIGAIGKGIELGSGFGGFGSVIGGLIGSGVVAFLQVVFVLFCHRFTRRPVNPPSSLVAPDNIEEASQANGRKPREVHPLWFAPIAFGMFGVVGAIGWGISGRVAFLWNCLGLAIATVIILGLAAVALVSLCFLDHVLAMPAKAIASKQSQRRAVVRQPIA
jgi:hypothetical protein